MSGPQPQRVRNHHGDNDDEGVWVWSPPSDPTIVIPESPESPGQQQQPTTQNVEPTTEQQHHQLENPERPEQQPQLELNPNRGRRAEPCTCAGCGRVREGVMATSPSTTTTEPPSPNTQGGRGRGRLAELITLAREGRLTQPNINRFFRPRSSRGRGVGRGLPRGLDLDDITEGEDEERLRGSSNPDHGESERLMEVTPPPPPPGWLSARRGRPRAHVPPQPRVGDTRRGVEEPTATAPQPQIPVEQAGEVRPVNSQNYISLEDRRALVRHTEARLRADPPLQWFLIPAAVGAIPLTPAPGSIPPPPPPAAPPAPAPAPASSTTADPPPTNPPSPESGAGEALAASPQGRKRSHTSDGFPTRECRICYVRVSDACLLPCGHAAICLASSSRTPAVPIL
ncbi:uncharacterized protein LOC135470859 [Liolophura sinensis]|uniref:uncharacterized protein LOC135470859 n=1 Tax=Liolophura sinensis TaxID=3198878 RepID=UPI0031593BB7